MTIPSKLVALIERLNQELNEIESSSLLGLNLARDKLETFPNNPRLIQLFGSLNNYLLFVEIARRRIAYESVILDSAALSDEQIQTAGEDLSELLGRAIDSKMAVDSVKNRLENWQ
jgi:hypothetical protein